MISRQLATRFLPIRYSPLSAPRLRPCNLGFSLLLTNIRSIMSSSRNAVNFPNIPNNDTVGIDCNPNVEIPTKNRKNL